VALGLLGATLGGALIVLGVAFLAPLPAGVDLDGVPPVDSPVTYRDGVTPIGVFFDEDHRRYVAWDALPPAWVAALVAAEDDAFFSHHGVDPVHVARAAWANFRAGHVVSGGSTLTQQTAKNLLERSDRTLVAKVRELIVALQLEARLSKAAILTLYANEFHVTGNGRGLGIAAKHFFDADPDALTLPQTAFLAGFVKAPAHYDPFSTRADERRAALDRAEARTRYVLRRLTEVPADRLAGPTPGLWASAEAHAAHAQRAAVIARAQAEARELLDHGFDLHFQRGVFRWAPSAVLDEVARRLAEPPLDRVLADAGIADPDRAGLRIVTTLDEKTQRAAEYGLWHSLTETGLLLEGVQDGLTLPAEALPRLDPSAPPGPRSWLVGRIAARAAGAVTVDLGGRTCTLDTAALQRVGDAWRRGARGSTAVRAGPTGRGQVLDALPVGAVVQVSLRPGHPDRCDLEVRPRLQGAAVVIEDGRIRALVGGSDNRFFDRATALRQMGSAWKPIVAHAALQLGWSPTDLLDNRPTEFRWSTTRYAPHPAHVSTDTVTLAWMVARSENVAAVWLLAHLTDHLSHTETARVAEQVDLAPRPGESRERWRARLEGDGVSPSSADASLFQRARQRVLARIRQASNPEDALVLASMTWDQWRALGHPRDTDAWYFELDPMVGPLHASTVEAMERELELDPLRERVTKGEVGRWDPELLYWDPDFRLLLGMRYVARVARQYGVRSDVREVLSMPLGASEITLEELAMAYDGLASGETWRFGGRDAAGRTGPIPASTLLVEEIRDRDGRVIYRAEPNRVPVTSPAVAAMTRDLLRNVVDVGTGRRASGAVKVGGAALPLAGKTGTTNDHRNAAFVGLVPLVGRSGIEDALTVAVYVGYDDNRPLVNGSLALQGASGALPAWLVIAEGLADEGVLADDHVRAPRGGWRWPDPPGTERVAVSPRDGFPTFASTGTTVLSRPGTGQRWLDPVERFDAPTGTRQALSTRDADTWIRAWEEQEQQDRDLRWSAWAREVRERLAREEAASEAPPAEPVEASPEPPAAAPEGIEPEVVPEATPVDGTEEVAPVRRGRRRRDEDAPEAAARSRALRPLPRDDEGDGVPRVRRRPVLDDPPPDDADEASEPGEEPDPEPEDPPVVITPRALPPPVDEGQPG
jgi:membrane peptidoglycan carboxypeptidase